MKRDAAFLGTARIFSAASAFFSLLYLAKTRSVENVGDINASLAAIQVIALLFGFGFPTSIIYYAKGSLFLARRLAFFCYIASAVVGLVVIAVISFFKFSYTFVLFSALGIALIAQLSGYLQSLELYSKYAFLLILQALILPLSNLISVWFMRGENVFFVYATIAFLLFLVCGGLWMRSGGSEDLSGRKLSWIEFLKYGFNSLYFNLTSSLYYSADVLLLKFFLAAEFLGAYSTGASLAKSSWLVVDSIGQVIFPRKVAGRLSDQDYKKIAQGCYIFSTAVFVGWIFLGRSFLELIFGDGYIDSYYPTAILLFGSIFLAYYKLQSRLLAAENAWRALSISQLSGLSVSVICIAVLSNVLGIEGSALGQALGFVISALILFALNKRRLLRN